MVMYIKDIEIIKMFLYKAMNIILQEFDRNNFELNFEVNKLVKNNRNWIEVFISRIINYSHNEKDILQKYKNVNFMKLVQRHRIILEAEFKSI